MFNKSTHILALIALLIFSGCLAVFVLFSYMVTKEKNEYTAHRVARAEKEEQRAALRALQSTLDETKEDRESLNTRILRDEEVIDFLALIESLGREQGVSLTTNSLNVLPIDDTFETLVMNVAVVGPYDAVVHMLKLLEQIPYQGSVLSVQIIREEVEGAKPLSNEWSGTFAVKVTKFKKI